MLGRRMVRRQRARGLVGAMATTAVVAGTATAVSGAVQNRQAKKQQAAYNEQALQQQASEDAEMEHQQVADLQEQVSQLQAQQVQQAVSPPAGDDLIAKLTQLASLHDAGALTDAEFEAAKAQLLGG